MLSAALVVPEGPEKTRDVAFVKRVLVGRPLATTEMEHQRIPKTIALAVFSSDAISSTAYATEEILFVVAVGGSSLALGLNTLIPIGDRGRGPADDRRHVVPADDLRLPERRRQLRGQPREPRREPVAHRRRVTARRLHPHRRGVDLGRRRGHRLDPGVPGPRQAPGAARPGPHRRCISLANLRGIKESGRIFAVPTYIYIVDPRRAGGLRAVYRSFVARRHPTASTVDRRLQERATASPAARSAIFILFKGFSSGAVALTGVEAISNGVPAFRRPESKNAATTLVWMGIILGTLFMGVQILAHHLGPYPSEQHDRDRRSSAPRCSAAAPCCTWCCSSRPRRSSRSPRTPRTPTSRGCRRSSPATATCPGSSPTAATGWCSRTACSCSPARRACSIIAFGGITNALIPLYAVGVFLSFTLSQAGMVPSPPEGAREGLQAQHRDQRGRLGRDRASCCSSSPPRSSRAAPGCRSW